MIAQVSILTLKLARHYHEANKKILILYHSSYDSTAERQYDS